MERTLNIMLLTAIVVLALLNVVVFAQGRHQAEHPPAVQSDSARWAALSQAQRFECVQRYQALVRRPDGQTALGQAREFAGLSAEEQVRRRGLHEILQTVLDRQSPAERRELLRLPARARAYFVYRAMVADLPEWLSKLQALRPEKGGAAPRRTWPREREDELRRGARRSDMVEPR